MTARSRTSAATRWVPPYPPSWFDRYSDWIDRVPGRSWRVHAVQAVVLGLATGAAHWIAGALPVGRLDPYHVIIGTGIPGILIFSRYLKRKAGEALDSFRPALATTPQLSRALRYRLTVLPARPTLVWGLATVAGFPAIASGILAVTGSGFPTPPSATAFIFVSFDALHVAPLPLPIGVMALLLLPSWWVLGTLFFQVIRQLRTIEEIYSRHTKVSLFQGTPFHAFSRHTARVGITLILFGNGVVLVPELPAPTIAFVAAQTLLGVAAFLLPLLGIHGLLVKEKDRLLTANSLRTQAMVGRLHASLRKKSLRGLDEIDRGISSLEREHLILSRIPTWPWQPGTLRGIIAAVLLPVFIWTIQFFLGRILG